MLLFSGTLRDIECEIDAIDVPSNGKGVTKPGRYFFSYAVLDNSSIVEFSTGFWELIQVFLTELLTICPLVLSADNICE